MSEQNTGSPTDDGSLHRDKARLRKAGLIILIVGLCSAGIVYWIGSRAEDPALAGYRQAEARAESRQMEMLYGTSGDIMQKLLIAMKQPGNQALAIVAVTALVSCACFYLGRPITESGEAG